MLRVLILNHRTGLDLGPAQQSQRRVPALDKVQNIPNSDILRTVEVSSVVTAFARILTPLWYRLCAAACIYTAVAFAG